MISDNSTIFITSSNKEFMSDLIEKIIQSKSDISRIVRFSKDCPYTSERVQEEIMKPQWTLFSERHTHPEKDRRIIAVFDECFLDDTWRIDPCMNSFFTSGRTLSITSLFALSHMGGISPSRRHGIDVLFVGPSQELKRIYDQFIYHCSFEEFSKKVEEGVMIRLDVVESVIHTFQELLTCSFG